MDAHALLTSQGWRGTGNSLHPTSNNIGLSKPLLVSQKQDNRGIGKKQHRTSDMWWMNAFDSSLKGLDTSQAGKVVQTNTTGGLDMVIKGGSKWVGGKGGLYASFVRGEGLHGTLTPESMEDVQESVNSGNSRGKKRKRDETKEERRTRKAAKLTLAENEVAIGTPPREASETKRVKRVSWSPDVKEESVTVTKLEIAIKKANAAKRAQLDMYAMNSPVAVERKAKRAAKLEEVKKEWEKEATTGEATTKRSVMITASIPSKSSETKEQRKARKAAKLAEKENKWADEDVKIRSGEVGDSSNAEKGSLHGNTEEADELHNSIEGASDTEGAKRPETKEERKARRAAKKMSQVQKVNITNEQPPEETAVMTGAKIKIREERKERKRLKELALLAQKDSSTSSPKPNIEGKKKKKSRS